MEAASRAKGDVGALPPGPAFYTTDQLVDALNATLAEPFRRTAVVNRGVVETTLVGKPWLDAYEAKAGACGPADLSEILERGRSASPADFLPARGQSPRDFLPARSRSPADLSSGKYLPADLRSQSPRGSHGSLTPRAAAPKYLPADLSGSGGQRRRPSWDHRP